MHNRASQSTSSLIVTSLFPVQAGEREPKEKKNQRTGDWRRSQGYILLLLLFTVEVCNRTTGLCGSSCQPLTVHCVKLVIISSLKPRPVRRPSLPSPPPARADAADGTLKQDVSVREVNLRCDGVANIMASFIDTDCSDTSKSGPINLQAGGGVTGACEGAAALQHSDKCLFDLLYWRFRDAAALSGGLKDGVWSDCLLWTYSDFSRQML